MQALFSGPLAERAPAFPDLAIGEKWVVVPVDAADVRARHLPAILLSIFNSTVAQMARLLGVNLMTIIKRLMLSTSDRAHDSFVRGQKVMLDRDLAALYGVTTESAQSGGETNADRFPDDFMFPLSREEIGTDITICDILAKATVKVTNCDLEARQHSYLPAFTEQGVAMLSSVLRSERAVKVNIAIMRAFVKLRETMETNRELAQQVCRARRTRRQA